jgi:uncharacterized protein
MTPLRTIEHQHARQLNITRQHLDAVERPALFDVVRDLGCLQLDPISAVQRSHLLVLWSRMGDYDPNQVDKLVYQDRVLFEYWAHEASIVLTEDYPIHRWRMRGYPFGGNWGDSIRNWMSTEGAPLRAAMLARFRDEGPLPARAFEDKTDRQFRSSGWTSPRDVSQMLMHLWHSGEIGVARREGIQRFWDLAERCLPDWTPREEWEISKIVEHAVQRSIRALGVARPDQIIQHYVRRRYPDLTTALTSLVNQGILEQVTITKEGTALPGNWYVHTADIPTLERIQAGTWQPRTTLLSPFDNLICDRKRLKLLFDFDYSIEIYTPQAKRQYGYYVLPILHGDTFIGRIDPRYDRKQRAFVIHAVHSEAGATIDAQAVTATGEAIKGLAHWLGAKTIEFSQALPDEWRALETL